MYKMTKKESLAKSRDENQNEDLVDLEVQSKAANIGVYVSFLLCDAISIIELIFTKHVSLQCWMIFTGTESTIFLVKFIKMHKKHDLFVCICHSLAFILFAINFILTIIKK